MADDTVANTQTSNPENVNQPMSDDSQNDVQQKSEDVDEFVATDNTSHLPAEQTPKAIVSICLGILAIVAEIFTFAFPAGSVQYGPGFYSGTAALIAGLFGVWMYHERYRLLDQVTMTVCAVTFLVQIIGLTLGGLELKLDKLGPIYSLHIFKNVLVISVSGIDAALMLIFCCFGFGRAFGKQDPNLQFSNVQDMESSQKTEVTRL